MPTTATTYTASQALTRDEYRGLVTEETTALGDWSGWGGQVDWDALYASRHTDFRCVCCMAIVVADLTGYYDGSTCFACGTAQEAGDELATYDATVASRTKALRRHYSQSKGRRMYSRSRKVLDTIFWLQGDRNVYPTHHLRLVQQDLAI